jgi:hypothetical protein
MRGKSTLLNALVDEAILPIGVVPVTAVPTVLRYGVQRTARVLINSTWLTIAPNDLAHYVSEELNPENRKCVEGVEVLLPSPLLAQGMCRELMATGTAAVSSEVARLQELRSKIERLSSDS